MAIQKTPPLGWPHTEAAEHLARESREILRKGEELGHGAAKPPPAGGKRQGCGCVGGLVSLLFALAVVGVAIYVLVPEYVTTTLSAEEVFLDSHPEWEVETTDVPEGMGGTVRLVVWDYNRAIGRLALMDPVDFDPGWIERPLIRGDLAAADEGELLDAFSDSFADLSWSYMMEAEPMGGSGDGSKEVWRVYYRVWGEDDGVWTDVMTTTATRIPETGSWSVERSYEASPTTP